MKKLLIILLIGILPTLAFSQSTTTDSKNWKHTGTNAFTKPLTIESQSLTGTRIANYDKLVSDTSRAYQPGSTIISVAASDASTLEKENATYVCDGTNDEVQWGLANTDANGGDVYLFGHIFNIGANITLTSKFIGTGCNNISTVGTFVIVTNPYQIKLTYPGDLRDMRIKCTTRTSSVPMVLMYVDDNTTAYEHKYGLLQGVYISNDNVSSGVGLQIFSNPTNGSYKGFYYNTFGNIDIKGFSTNLSLKCRKSGTANYASINQNIFEGILLSNADTMMTFDVTGTGAGAPAIQMNIFKYVSLQGGTNTVGIYLSNSTETRANQFTNIVSMDWGATPVIQLGGPLIYLTYARGYIPVIDYGGNAKNNDVISTGTPMFKNGGTVTIASNVLTLASGAGEYLVEGEGGASDIISELYGVNRGDVIILRRATAGHVITVKTAIGIGADVALTNAGDFVMLLAISTYQYILLSKTQ